jgi:hypothetical protein
VALSPKEQNKIVQMLGYGGKTIQAGSVIYNKILNDRLHSMPPELEELVRCYLNQIWAIETQMFQAPGRLVAKEVQDIKMNLQELQMLRSERKKIAREIADAVDVPYLGAGASIRLAL